MQRSQFIHCCEVSLSFVAKDASIVQLPLTTRLCGYKESDFPNNRLTQYNTINISGASGYKLKSTRPLCELAIINRSVESRSFKVIQDEIRCNCKYANAREEKIG